MVLIHMGNAYASFHLPVIEKSKISMLFPDNIPSINFSLFGERRPGVEEALDAYLTLIPNDGYAEVLPKAAANPPVCVWRWKTRALPGGQRRLWRQHQRHGYAHLCLSIGVAMGNAPDEVKAAADFVTGTCEESGVAGALHNLGFLSSDEEYEHFINK